MGINDYKSTSKITNLENNKKINKYIHFETIIFEVTKTNSFLY